jgi:hypothetical protein
MFLLLSPLFCHGWNSEAHFVIGHLAESLLTDRALTYTQLHLRGESLAEVSGWADTVEWSDELHFGFTHPYRDCSLGFVLDESHCRGGRCIVTAITNYTQRAADLSLSTSDRAEALKFLVHLYGDIHQPLHLGFREDAGGNRIMLDEGVSLHELWDSTLVGYARGKRVKAAVRRNKGVYTYSMLGEDLMAEFKDRGVTAADALAIADEISRTRTCSTAYMDETGSYFPASRAIVSDEYKRSRGLVVRDLLKISAARLAAGIESIAGVFCAEMDRIKSEKKALTKASPIPLVPTTPIPTLTSNRFSELSVEFDLEEAAQVELGEEHVMSDSRRERRKPRTKLPHLILSLTDDFSDIVLIRRGKLFFITVHALGRKRTYSPTHSHSVWVMNRKRDGRKVPHLVSFDCAVFGQQRVPSAEVMTKALAQVGNEHVKTSSGLVATSNGLRPGDANRELSAGTFEARMDLYRVVRPFMRKSTCGTLSHAEQVARFQARFATTCIFIHGGLLLVVESTTLQEDPTQFVMKFNKHKVIDKTTGSLSLVLIERDLFDSIIDKEVGKYLHLLSVKQLEISRSHVHTRRTLPGEMVILERLLYEPDETVKAQLAKRNFAFFIVCPDSDEINFWHMQWELDDEKIDRLMETQL